MGNSSMKTCGNCFRYIEDWCDAKAKGLEANTSVMPGGYHRKPRPGIRPRAIGINCPDVETICASHPACHHYEARWRWNLRTWWSWHLIPAVKEFYRQFVRVPIGSRRTAVPLEWKDSFDGIADRIIPDSEPVCPHCGEMPYSYEQCVFCGQRFLPDELQHDKTAPQRALQDGEIIMFRDGICPECGCSCGNGGYGPLRCRCGWVGSELSEKVRRDIDELFAKEFGESEESQ